MSDISNNNKASKSIISIRLPIDFIETIDDVIAAKPLKISRTKWIIAACLLHLENEKKFAKSHKIMQYVTPSVGADEMKAISLEVSNKILQEIDNSIHKLPYNIARSIWIFNACLYFVKSEKRKANYLHKKELSEADC